MRLTRTVPQHTRTEQFQWIEADFLEMGPAYRRARAQMCKPMDTCWWCQRPFADGDMIALAGRVKGANVVLCQTCAAEAAKERP